MGETEGRGNGKLAKGQKCRGENGKEEGGERVGREECDSSRRKGEKILPHDNFFKKNQRLFDDAVDASCPTDEVTVMISSDVTL